MSSILRTILELFLLFLIISIFGGFILSLVVDVSLALPSAIVLAIIIIGIYHFFIGSKKVSHQSHHHRKH